jgi:hypothetical protein
MIAAAAWVALDDLSRHADLGLALADRLAGRRGDDGARLWSIVHFAGVQKVGRDARSRRSPA